MVKSAVGKNTEWLGDWESKGLDSIGMSVQVSGKWAVIFKWGAQRGTLGKNVPGRRDSHFKILPDV